MMMEIIENLVMVMSMGFLGFIFLMPGLCVALDWNNGFLKPGPFEKVFVTGVIVVSFISGGLMAFGAVMYVWEAVWEAVWG